MGPTEEMVPQARQGGAKVLAASKWLIFAVAAAMAIRYLSLAKATRDAGEAPVETRPWANITKDSHLQEAIDADNGPLVAKLLPTVPPKAISLAAVERLTHDATSRALDAFLAAGWDVHGLDHHEIPLCDAIVEDQQGVAKVLLSHGADPNGGSGNDGRALDIALRSPRDSIKLITLLLDHGAKPNRDPYPGEGRMQPLDVAVLAENIEGARLLLKRGADPDSVRYIDASQGAPPLVEASQSPLATQLTQLLLEYGAMPDKEGIQYLQNVPATESKVRGTALYFNSFLNHADSVRLLLSHGADPLKRAGNGRSPVDVAKGACLDLLKGASVHHTYGH